MRKMDASVINFISQYNKKYEMYVAETTGSSTAILAQQEVVIIDLGERMETLDFTVPTISTQAILPQIVLVATALCVLIVDVFKRKSQTALISYMSLAGSILAAACLLLAWPAVGVSVFSGMVFTDGFSFFVNLTILIILILTIMISINYKKFFERINC